MQYLLAKAKESPAFLPALFVRGTLPLMLAVAAGLVSSESPRQAKGAERDRPPNIVYILADDLGWCELGCYGQEKMKTPNLDRLAAEGMRFTQHYAGNAVCAPSRCVLMTGKHPGHAYTRNNGNPKLSEEFMARYGLEWAGQHPIPDAEVTIAEMLKQKGYATGAMGKWGLGQIGTTGDPNRQGFDLFFGYNCQAHAHSFYPGHLWRNHEKVLLHNNPPVPGHAKLPEGADPLDPASYAPFKGQDYSADRTIDEALAFIRQNKDRPFFLYYPTTLVHVALHIPDEELKPYLGKWDETPFTGGGYTPHMTPRAAYAAMVSRLDRDAGRIVALVDELGLGENTLVMFSSDNGTTHLEKEVDYEFFESVGPLRGLKGTLFEGGIRVPMIARWTGKVRPGSVTDHISMFSDVLPTVAEAAAVAPPEEIDGVSFLPTLLGRPDEQRKPDYLYWEFPGYGGQQAVRMGDWKAIRTDMLRKNNPDPLAVQLYNLSEDVGEANDVAAAHPELVARFRKIMKDARTPSELFPIRPLDEQ